MNFDFHFSVPVYVLLGTAFAALLYITIVYVPRILRVVRHRKECNTRENAEWTQLPPVSVVVYSNDDANILEKTLPYILKQDYPAPFEVVVVNDGANADTEMTVTRLQNDYPNLYITFAPDGARNLSRKKLALTLGIKAAKNDIVVITDAGTKHDSVKWLQAMVSPFVKTNIGVVAGYSAPRTTESAWPGRKILGFDAVADAVTWMNAAISGKTYRADSTNLAFRRNLFFENKGFSRSLNLKNGDDDIFVSELASLAGVEVQLNDESMGTCGFGFPMKRFLHDSRVSHAFTGRKLRKKSRRLMAAGETFIWAVLACSLAAAALTGFTNLVTLIAAGVFILWGVILPVVVWRKALISLHGYKTGLRLVYIIPFRPLRNLLAQLRSRRAPSFTWQ